MTQRNEQSRAESSDTDIYPRFHVRRGLQFRHSFSLVIYFFEKTVKEVDIDRFVMYASTYHLDKMSSCMLVSSHNGA